MRRAIVSPPPARTESPLATRVGRTVRHRGFAAFLILTTWAGLPACEAPSSSFPVNDTLGAGVHNNGKAPPTSLSPIVAYVAGQPIREDTVLPALIEAAGSTVLEEVALDVLLRRELHQRDLNLSAGEIAEELSALSAALSDDADEAARLLRQLRDRRGLGDERFDRLLRRNAMLRKLVAADVTVAELQIRKAYQLRYGPRYRVRLITADDAATAQRLRARALAGESFSDLAATHSTDESRAQGGLLAPISPEDATYPQAVRNALPRLDPDHDAGLSPILALDGGYAVLKLEEALPPQDVSYETARDELAQSVRRQNERLLMEQQARALLDEAEVLVLNPELKRQWDTRE